MNQRTVSPSQHSEDSDASKTNQQKESIEGYETFQLFKDYMDCKLKTFKRDIIEESEERSFAAFKRARRDSEIPSFRFKGNQLQYKFNAGCLDKIDTAFRYIKSSRYSDCVGILQDLSSDISRRNKHIRLADRSPSGWAVVAELEGDDIASGSEEERRFEKAENKALRKRRASSFRTRGRPNYVAPSATVSSASMVDTSRETTTGQSQPFRSMVKRGPAPNQQCYFCGGFGHWRVACPAAASLRAAQSASSDSVQSNQDAVVKNPPPSFSKNNQSALRNGTFVVQAIQELLRNSCIVELDSPPLVVNPLSVAIQRSGKKRLILDLRFVNQFVYKRKIVFEGYKTALDFVQDTGFMFKFDLKSGYHHIDIHSSQQQYLGFAWNANGIIRYYCFTVLPFGLTSAPYIFTKCIRPLVTYWRRQSIHIVVYLDDGFGYARSKDLCSSHSDIVRDTLEQSGFVVNIEKSVWHPVTELEWLGFTWNLDSSVLSIPVKKTEDIVSSFSAFTSVLPRFTARSLAALAGKVIALTPVLGDVCRLFTRHMYSEVQKASSWDRFLRLNNSHCVYELLFWRDNLRSLKPRALSTMADGGHIL
ncbi:uncharacterized protein [Haliotis asinina]|uniref:uncharacterized protein n=1 Tax=Haliotis asinina TaxID=109174 RepID=UPI0035327309